MNDSCLNNANVSVPEIDVVKEVSVDTAMDVLEKEVSGSTSAGVNAVVSRNKRKRPKRNSAKCGVNSIAQDNVGVSIPETDVIEKVPSNLTTSVLENEVLGGVNNVVSKKSKRKRKKEALAGVNSDMGVLEKDVSVSAGVISTMGVLEKEALAEVNGNIGVLEKDVSAVLNNVVPKKSRRKRKKEALAGVNSDMGVLEKEASVSAGVISTMGVLEKEALAAEVNGNIGVLEKDVSAVVNDVVPKKSRRKRKKEALAGVNSDMGALEKEVSVSAGVISTMGVLEKEALAAEVNGNIGVLEKDVSAVVDDVVSKKRKRKCKRLDNVSVGNPKTDVEEVSVQSNLTSSPEKFHIPPVDTTMGILEKEVSGGVDVVVSKKKKRKPKRSTMEMTCLDNVSVGIPKTDVREEVPVESNLTSSGEKFHISPIDTTMGVLDMEVLASAGVDDVVSKKRKRKPKRLDNVNVGTPITDVLEEVPVESNLACSPEKLQISPVVTTLGVLEKEVSGGVNAVLSKKKKRKPKRSSIEMTCLDNVSDGIPKTDGIEELLVESNLTSSPEKFHISSVDTRNGDEEKEVSGGVDVVVSKKKKRKPKHSTMEMTCLDNVSVGIPKTDALEEVQVQLNLTSSGEKFHISPVDTTVGVLDREVSASAGVDDVVSKKRKRKPKCLDNVNVGTPKTDVLEEVPVESNLTRSREKLHISPADTTMDVLEKEVSGGVNISVKKRERKSKLKKMNDCSSIERTCLDNVTVKPVSGVTDNVSGVTDNISLSDINNDVMANDHPVATCSVDVNSNGNPLDTTTILKSRRKLLVLDVNGLLADIVSQCPRRFKPDFTLAKKIVFKRPFCDDFLRFCFEKFDVGIWSSRTKKNLTRVVDLLMNNMKDKLLFCWDGSRCTNTGFKTLEDKHKPLVLKELKNLWESKANHLPSQRRFYDESNTILLDDSPYKALRNPPYTAIHPKAYSFADVKDKSLGPNGDIRLYLERLAEAENVQEFIQANPFGHQSITNAHPSWNFYSKLVRNQAGKRNFNYQRP